MTNWAKTSSYSSSCWASFQELNLKTHIDEYGLEGAGCATLDILAEEGLYRWCSVRTHILIGHAPQGRILLSSHIIIIVYYYHRISLSSHIIIIAYFYHHILLSSHIIIIAYYYHHISLSSHIIIITSYYPTPRIALFVRPLVTKFAAS